MTSILKLHINNSLIFNKRETYEVQQYTIKEQNKNRSLFVSFFYIPIIINKVCCNDFHIVP